MNSHNLFEFDESQNKIVIGTDEAGRGPAAGGVFASAVCFPENCGKLIEELSILNDSKQLSKKKRESIYDLIKNETINSTVCIEVEEIEKINILNASLKAMKLACEIVIARINSVGVLCTSQNELKDMNAITTSKSQISPRNDMIVLVDGNKLIKDFKYPQKFVIKGDAKSASIAAASILAKVTRDRYMEELDKEFPEYLWSKNAGYLTKEHLAAIDKHGLTPHHRPSFLRKHFAKSAENPAPEIQSRPKISNELEQMSLF